MRAESALGPVQSAALASGGVVYRAAGRNDSGVCGPLGQFHLVLQLPIALAKYDLPIHHYLAAKYLIRYEIFEA